MHTKCCEFTEGLHFSHIHEFYSSSAPSPMTTSPLGRHCGQTHNSTPNTKHPLHTLEFPTSSPFPGVNSNRISWSSLFEFLWKEENFIYWRPFHGMIGGQKRVLSLNHQSVNSLHSTPSKAETHHLDVHVEAVQSASQSDRARASPG